MDLTWTSWDGSQWIACSILGGEPAQFAVRNGTNLRDGRQNYTLRLSSLSVPHSTTRGWLLVMIPFDRNDPRNFFTVELRTPHNYDKGITMVGDAFWVSLRSGK